MSWLTDIVERLEAAGVGTPGTDLFYGPLPDDPKSCGAVVPYPGAPPEEQFGATGPWLLRPRAQFSWRAETPDGFELAFEKATVAFDSLSSVGHATMLGNTKVYTLAVLQSPSMLYLSDDGSPVCGFNFEVEHEK